jgi:replicative DNA helicase
MREGEDIIRRQQASDAAERSVLGSMLRCNSVILDAAQAAAEDDYATDQHRRLYRAIVEAHGSDGRPVDLVILAERLSRSGHLEDVGGPAYLASLWDAAPTAANWEHYARIVRERALMRRLAACAQAVAALAERPGGEADDAVEEAERLVFAVAQRQQGRAVRLDKALDEWEQGYDERATRGAVPGVEPGIPGLASVVPGFMPGELVIVAARPAVGKTAVALALARAAARNGTGVLFCSLEMPRGQLAERLIAAEARIDGQHLRLGTLPLSEVERMAGACRVLRGLPVWIDDAASQSVQRICGTARRLAARHGIGLVVVDYAGLIRPADPRRSRHEQVGHDSGALKALAKDLGVPVLLLAQLNREVTSRSDGKPRLSDLRDSGSLEQDCDTCVLLHQPDPSQDRLDFIVAKQRSGPTGECSARFIRPQLRFAEWDRGPFDDGRAA